MKPAINSESIAKAKIAIRKTIIQKREKLSSLKKNEKSIAIAKRLFGMDEFKKSKSVFCFLSTPAEVQTDWIIRESLGLGKQVLVPLLDSKDANLKVASIASMDIEFVAGIYGVREPSPKFRKVAHFSSIDFIVAPGLAFDIFGNRVGYGGGFYDNFFKKISRDVTRVAIAYGFQLLDKVPYTELDESIHFLVTEVTTLKCHNSKGTEV
jgi:5-formyltetrahydrofolate cyclo-ligase